MKQLAVLLSFTTILASCSLYHKVVGPHKSAPAKDETASTSKKKKKNSTGFSHVLNSKDNEYRLKMAEQYYATGKYSYAQQLFESLFPYVKGTPRYEDVYYKFAYSYYNDKDYINAENIFKSFTETFPASPRAEECDYMRAYCYYKQSPKVELDQTNTNKAINLMQVFINSHPGSARNKEATDIIDKCRAKLEAKEAENAELYYNLGFFKAAAISYTSVSDNFPDSKHGDEYKLQAIRAYYRYAEMSYAFRQEERFGKVISECADFTERFPDSKLLPDVVKYRAQSNNYLKNLKNEQAKTASER